MKLATVRTPEGTRAVRLKGASPIDLGAADVVEFIGHARKPARYLVGGEAVVAEIEGLGRCENTVVKDS